MSDLIGPSAEQEHLMALAPPMPSTLALCEQYAAGGLTRKSLLIALGSDLGEDIRDVTASHQKGLLEDATYDAIRALQSQQ